MWETLLDALIDSLKLFATVLVLYILISFVEENLAERLKKAGKISPLVGTTFGLIPQCGFSVVAADLYRKKHISLGTLLGVFIATSDEAIPVLFASGSKMIMILPLIAVKFVYGLIVAYSLDLIFSSFKKKAQDHLDHCETDHAKEVHVGCCGHEIEDAKEEKPLHRYLLHPLVHSLKIFAAVLVINVIFGILVYYIGEDKIASFLQSGKYLSPVFSVLLGLVPNCAASVIIAKLYVTGGISFGATIAGLTTNAGLGLLFLFKNGREWKNNLLITGLLVMAGIVIGYVTLAIELAIA